MLKNTDSEQLDLILDAIGNYNWINSAVISELCQNETICKASSGRL